MIDRVLAARTDNFVDLVRASGLSPTTDFQRSLLRGVDFRGCDLGSFDFTGTTFRSCQFAGSRVAGAKLDDASFEDCDPSAADDWAGFARGTIRLVQTLKHFSTGTEAGSLIAPRTRADRVSWQRASSYRQIPLIANRSQEDMTLELAADWEHISQILGRELNPQLYDDWIRPIQLGLFDRATRTLDLYLETEDHANGVADRFLDILTMAWRSVRSDVEHVRIVVHPGRYAGGFGFGEASDPYNRDTEELASVQGRALGLVAAAPADNSIGLDPSLTFSNFVVGNANLLASNAAIRAASADPMQFSPLYLKADTAQGKTHLLHAIGNDFLENHPRGRVFYCSAERFMVEFVEALRENALIGFKTRLRSFDLLLIDDIQFIIGKASAQEELLYTIDAMLAQGKRLVVAADRAPQALHGIDQLLLARLAMGLIADIGPADLELRLAILEERLATLAANQPKIAVPANVVELLARTINRNVSELVGGLNKLIAYAQLTGEPVSLDLAREQLVHILAGTRNRITIDEIQLTVCQFYRIDRSALASKRRIPAVLRARQVAMYLSKVLTPGSYSEIGGKFGCRSPATVAEAVRMIEDRRAGDPDMDGEIRFLLGQVEAALRPDGEDRELIARSRSR